MAAYWRERYDLRHILERDWKKLGPKLAGKIHIYCGDMDNYYLNNAVYLMEDFLRGHYRSALRRRSRLTATAPSTAGTATRRVRTPSPGCATIRCTSPRSWTGSGNPRRRDPTSPPGGIRVDLTIGLVPVADRTDQDHRDRGRRSGDRLRPAGRSGPRPDARRADPGGAAARGVFPRENDGNSRSGWPQPGPFFKQRVWAELRKIPFGATATYGGIAAAMEMPGAARAVGRANHLNPVSIVIPCHRVIGACSELTGYGGGLWRKRWLLEHERSVALTGRPAPPPVRAGK